MTKKLFFIFLLILLLAAAPALTVSAEDIPTGQTEDETKKEKKTGITADVFGDEGGVFHPFFTAETIWSSNIFYTEDNEDSGFTTTLSPGIWIALPESREKLMSLSTSNAAPGGVEYSHMETDSSRRMQTYFLYSPSFVYYSDEAKYNHTDHKAEALFKYNFGFDLALEIFDQYNIKSDINDDGLGKLLDEYDDNVFAIVLSYTPSPKFKVRVDYSNYFVEFDKAVNEFRDRVDNSMSAYVFYTFMPRTSAFIEYELTDVDYDSRNDYDSFEDRYYAGINWEISAKSKGQVKVGLLEKDFDEDIYNDQEDFSMEAQLQYAFTPKSSAALNAYQKYHETSMTDSYFIRTRGVNGAFLLRFSQKWSGAINASYVNETYQGSSQNGLTDERDDDTYGIGPAFKFDAKKWLEFEGGFHYTKRDSNVDVYDYANRMIYLRVKIAL